MAEQKENARNFSNQFGVLADLPSSKLLKKSSISIRP